MSDTETVNDAVGTEGTQENMCPICHGSITDPLTTSCGHAFCGACLQSWVESRINNGEEVSCPVCRNVIARPVERPPGITEIPALNFTVENFTVSVNFTAPLYYLAILGFFSVVQMFQIAFNVRLIARCDK